MESTSLGVQVHGGMGFIEETGAAQHMRDARILPIYEGTNGIQALDFVGRKCLRDGGEAIAELLAEMAETAALIDSANEQTLPLLKALEQAIAQCQQALDYVKANADRASYIAYHFLMLFGNSVSYWLMVKLAVAAQGRLEAGSDDRYYAQKIATTGFFASQILTRNSGYLSAVTSGLDSLDQLDSADFQTD
jgi:hypothetical protein